MSELKAPKCKYCGGEMRIGKGFDESVVSTDFWYFYDKCWSRSPSYESEEEAYAAATRTPPNRPLTLPELFDLDDNMDAVWVVDSGCGTVVMGAEEACEWASDADTVLFFAAKPTAADIETARKEDDCK